MRVNREARYRIRVSFKYNAIHKIVSRQIFPLKSHRCSAACKDQEPHGAAKPASFNPCLIHGARPASGRGDKRMPVPANWCKIEEDRRKAHVGSVDRLACLLARSRPEIARQCTDRVSRARNFGPAGSVTERRLEAGTVDGGEREQSGLGWCSSEDLHCCCSLLIGLRRSCARASRQNQRLRSFC